MEFRVHQKLRERIETEQRDMAFITLPGMGLSTLLESLSEVSNLLIAFIDRETLVNYWEKEYKNRKHNRRYVIHAATIEALTRSGYFNNDIDNPQIFSTNLPRFFQQNDFPGDEGKRIFVIIDDFDKLPNDLALIVCNELKALDDMSSESQYASLKSIRFLIGGPIYFLSIFKSNEVSGVSPATNFCKFRPYEFLLSNKEVNKLLETSYPELTQVSQAFLTLVTDWSGGYLHYVLGFAKWLVQEIHDTGRLTIQEIGSYLMSAIEEQDRIPLFEYCYSGWEKVKDDRYMLDLLQTAVSSGFVRDISETGYQLIRHGFLIEKRGKRGFLYPPNKLIELFLRQRLAEINLLLPIGESAMWAISRINSRAYSLLLEIENRLRCYIGDRIFSMHNAEWKIKGFDVPSSGGKNIYGVATERMYLEQQSIYYSPSPFDPFMTFLDVGDLRDIVLKNPEGFHSQFIEKFPSFLDEINYYRRRIAHNRPLTLEQVNVLQSRWNILQGIMAQKS